MNILKLREKHPTFTYQKAWYEQAENKIQFYAEFSVEPDITFTSKVEVIGVNQELLASFSNQDLERWAFLLGLVEIPSYWKATCSPIIDIKAGNVSKMAKKYLFELLRNGLSEFYFINEITTFGADDFVTINGNDAEKELLAPAFSKHSALQKVLIPLGGGKDSLVALRLLQDSGLSKEQLSVLVLEPATPAASSLAQAFGLHTIFAKRSIDPKLIELNNQGYLNGHTPFSAYLSVLSSCVGHLFGHSHVALANERSANEGNTFFHGLEINHQWSKSFEYEQLFAEFAADQLPSTTPYYFSLLRPLYELQIAKLFGHFYAENTSVLTTFRSCNRGQQQNIWCGECPKCLFAALILSPFLEPTKLSSILGQDLLNKESMITTADDLLGKGSNKPLECVGMYEESMIASYLTLQRFYKDTPDDQLPVVLRHIKQNVLSAEQNLDQHAAQLLTAWNDKNRVPPDLEQHLKEQFHAV
jgi:hypothetical protein